MFTHEPGMFAIIIGRWMVGIDWGMGLKHPYLFVFDMNADDDRFRFTLFGRKR